MHLLVTGASGFVGNAVISTLAINNVHYTLRASVRRSDVALPTKVDVVQTGDLSPNTDWRTALNGIQAVVHAAARVHVMNENADNPLAEFRRVNVEGTLNLAKQAADAGVRRFVFISSIKVNGEKTLPGHPYTADATPQPTDPYGVSKYEAEQQLLTLAQETGMEVVIIRPVLIYGPGVKANFLSMMRWLNKGVPLPLGAIHSNRRSMVAIENLVDLIVTCLHHPLAANQVFLVSDNEDLSTTELLQRTAKALHKPARLFPVPLWMLSAAAHMLGKADMEQRLSTSLQVNIEKTSALLGWYPPIKMDSALQATVAAFHARKE